MGYVSQTPSHEWEMQCDSDSGAILPGTIVRACSAPPQVSDSQLTMFVHAVFLLAVAVRSLKIENWNKCCKAHTRLPIHHGGIPLACTTLSLHRLPRIPRIYLYSPSRYPVLHAKPWLYDSEPTRTRFRVNTLFCIVFHTRHSGNL